jgi:hypothetical protein
MPPDPWEPVRFQVFCVFRMTVIIPGSISVTQFITHFYTHYNVYPFQKKGHARHICASEKYH